ncbi:MAG: hypothetical protein RL141_634 [Candidatus Parcubacteria bacterium]|jgi:hypothetical protein
MKTPLAAPTSGNSTEIEVARGIVAPAGLFTPQNLNPITGESPPSMEVAILPTFPSERGRGSCSNDESLHAHGEEKNDGQRRRHLARLPLSRREGDGAS